MASASADRNVRVDLATLVGFGLAGLALYAGIRDLSLVQRLLEMPYVQGIDVLFVAPEVLTGLLLPAIGLVVLGVALGYAALFDRRSRSVAFVVALTTLLLYWSAGVTFAATAVALAGAFAVLELVSMRARASGN
ncbi:hypothetical protein BRC86_11830 [Halobacteriales archaeon QS_3_64_16]|nr:MAG: hypothetical protein BRC86_11830 [Halobacteriales archaeon QS_3_64_16]